MAERRPLPPELPDPLLEALVELARSALETRRAAEEKRRTIAVVRDRTGRNAA